ncbi:hypothetical protein BC940DRAFT_282041 [Gongronella butleri]|nr:hypothetical protein BC940DRAFT_282041 [Gongronella butleri]
MPPSLRSCYDDLVLLLLRESTCKDIEPCGVAAVTLFRRACKVLPEKSTDDALAYAKSLVDLANEKLNSYRYDCVPEHWRQLLMDASLLHAACLRGDRLVQMQSPLDDDDARLCRELIRILDTALIVSGAPGSGRRALALEFVDALQALVRPNDAENGASWPVQNEKNEKNKKNAALTSESLSFPVTVLTEAPDFCWFEDHVNSPNVRPLVLRCGLLTHWPASSTRPWANLDYLVSVAGDRIVPVEVGRSYTDEHWEQALMPFHVFVDEHVRKTQPIPIYLAQHDLLHQIPRLERDIAVPDYCSVETELTDQYTARPRDDLIRNAWFGPAGTVSPLHHDPYHNLLAQVVGRKYVRLYNPSQTHALYPFTGMMANASQVDVEEPELDEFPLFASAEYVECVLEPGDVLYIPPKWWHYVRSLSTSFSVSFWF